jgi:GYF domain 2
MSPEDLIAKIGEIVGDDVSDGKIDFKYSWDSYEQAKALLLRIRTVQKELRLLRRQISATISSTKSDFSGARISVGKGVGSSIAAGFFGRKAVGRINASRRDDLRRAQIKTVAPYENVKRIIDQIITKLDEVKGKIDLSPDYQARPTRAAKPASTRPPPLPPASGRYYVYLNGEVKGPYMREQLIALYDTGTIVADTQCCLEGTEQWERYLDL